MNEHDSVKRLVMISSIIQLILGGIVLVVSKLLHPWLLVPAYFGLAMALFVAYGFSLFLLSEYKKNFKGGEKIKLFLISSLACLTSVVIVVYCFITTVIVH